MTSGSQAVSNRRRRLKELVVEFMGGKCFRCGWCEHPAGLTAHHVNPSKKESRLGSGNTGSWEKMKIEARKCLLLCSNCHNVIHAIKDPFYFDEKNIPTYEDLIEEREVQPPSKCVDCKQICSPGADRCVPCNAKTRTIISWPDVEELQLLVNQTSFVEVGRRLGVSDNAVRKRIRNHLFRDNVQGETCHSVKVE